MKCSSENKKKKDIKTNKDILTFIRQRAFKNTMACVEVSPL